MPNNEFFEQLVSAIAKTGASGRCMPDSEAWKKFLEDAPKQPSAPIGAPVFPAGENFTAPVQAQAVLPGTLDALCAQALACRNCPLCERRNNVVFGEGNPQADLMFIGEGPGFDEDRLG